MQKIKQSDPRAAFRIYQFLCVDTTNLQVRLQASDMGSFVVYLSKNGSTPALATASAPVENGATNMKGVFALTLSVADCDSPGVLAGKITNTGGTKTMEPREFKLAIDQAYMLTAVTGVLGLTSFTTSRPETTDGFWNNCLVTALSGSLVGQMNRVGGYVGSTKLITLSSGYTFTGAPVNGDVFELINR